MISAKLCHYTTKFNSERHKSPTIFSIHRTLILFFPYSLYYWAFQDPPCRHRRCKGSTSPLSMQANFVNASIHFAVVLPLLHNDDAKLAPIHLHALIRFVDGPHWFADAAFCISKHLTSVKNHLHFHTFLPKALHNPNKCFTFAVPEPAKPLNDAQMSGSFFYCHDNKNSVHKNILHTPRVMVQETGTSPRVSRIRNLFFLSKNCNTVSCKN